MRRFLIITHGTLSEGFKNTLSMITGAHSNVTAISAFIQNVSLEDLTKDFMSKVEEKDEVVVLTDLLGGSVNQFFIHHIDKLHFHLITGINLALLMSLVFYPQDKYLDENSITEEVKRAREQMVYMNAYIRDVDALDIEND